MFTSSFSRSQRSWLIDLASLALLLLIFYSLWLGSYPFFTPDEGRYSEIAREMVASGDYITPRVNGVAFLDKPVLYYWLQAGAIAVFGVQEWALRLFPMLAGVLGCLYLYVCSRLLFDRATALLAAGILATTPLYFGAAHYANMDLEVATWITGTLLSFITAVTSQGKRRAVFLLLAYVFAALAFLTKGLIGIAFPAMIIGSWIILGWRWRLLTQIHLLKGLALFVVLVAPWYILVEKATPGFLHFFFVTQQVTRFLSTAEFNNPTPVWFYLPVIIVGFIPWTCFLLQTLFTQTRLIVKQPKQHATSLYLLLWFCIILIFFSLPHSKMVGYILPVFAPLALLSSRYLILSWQSHSRLMHILTFSSWIGLCICIAVGFAIAPQQHIIELPTGFAYYAYIISAIFGAATILSILTLRQQKWFALVVICGLTSTLLCLTVVAGAHHLNQNSAKPIVMRLKQTLQADDEVVNYFKSYQDVPLYLQRQVSIVANWSAPDIATKDNWVRELWYGMAFQNTAPWLINEDTFWQRWQGKKRVFVFVNKNYLNQFRQHTKNLLIIDCHNDILLVSNQSNSSYPTRDNQCERSQDTK